MDTLPQNTGTAAPSGLDPQLVNLAKAIRTTESNGNFQATGKSGEYGAYQFMPTTWAATAPKFGVTTSLQQATPEQQNEVAYKQLAEWKTEHPDWNVGNFASAWNAGPGKPDAYIQGNVGTNSQGVSYDTPAYAQKVATAYQTFKTQTAGGIMPPADQATGTPEAAPSIGGFAQNVLQSGASLLGGVGEAVLHPIQTVQNIGGAAVGGLEKAAGETTDNTAKFDNVVNFFKDRYGSLDNLEKTLYHDPVGVAADLSTLLGGAGLALHGAKVGLDVAKAGEIGNVVGKAGEALGTASDFTNPLAPVAAGIGKLTGPALDAASGAVGKLAGFEPATIDSIRANPEAFTPNQIASVTREAVAKEVGSALNDRISSLDETGKAYEPIRTATVEDTSVSPSDEKRVRFQNSRPVLKLSDIPDEMLSIPELRGKLAQLESMPKVSSKLINDTKAAIEKRAPNEKVPANVRVGRSYIDNSIRQAAKVKINDGEISATGSSIVRDPKDIRALQSLYDLWKPVFAKGNLTNEEFLNFRSDLSKLSKFERETSKSTDLETTAQAIRANLNDKLRPQIPGLDKLDESYSSQIGELKSLKKGLIDKDGNLTDSAYSMVANAANPSNASRLARLEQIVPGITEKIKVLKAIEDIQKSMGNKVGTYGSSILEAGGAIGGLATGHLGVAATGFAAMIIAEPTNAVKIIRVAEKLDPKVIPMILGRLSRYATITSESNRAIQESPDTGTQQQPEGTSTTMPQNSQLSPSTTDASLETLASSKNFDLQAARDAGHSDQEIQTYLEGI